MDPEMTTRRRKSWTVTAATGAEHTATVYRDTEAGEFVVKLVAAGKPQRGADYFTSDEGDAWLTAKAMARQSAGGAQ
jgi:hypothetical protein